MFVWDPDDLHAIGIVDRFISLFLMNSVMSHGMNELYARFLQKSKIFSSMEEIQYYRKCWPTSRMVEDMVKSSIRSIEMKPYHVGLDISSSSTGICILSQKSNSNSCLFS